MSSLKRGFAEQQDSGKLCSRAGQSWTHTRSEVNSQCNGSCGVCGLARNIYAYVKVWLDYGIDNDMHSNDSAAPPQVTHCFLPDAATLSNVKRV